MRRTVKKQRRRQGKTDYRARIALLKSEKPRIVFRKTNRYIIGQIIESREAKDIVIAGVNSKQLLEYGWPEKNKGSLKSLPACYLSGFLLGKKNIAKKEAVFDIGLLRNIPKSRAYAFLKGVVDFGISVNCSEEIFPNEARIKGSHMKNDISKIFDKVKEKIKTKQTKNSTK